MAAVYQDFVNLTTRYGFGGGINNGLGTEGAASLPRRMPDAFAYPGFSTGGAPPPVRRLQQHWCGFSSREDVPGLSFCVLEGSQRLVLLRLVSRSSVGRRAHFFCDV